MNIMTEVLSCMVVAIDSWCCNETCPNVAVPSFRFLVLENLVINNKFFDFFAR